MYFSMGGYYSKASFIGAGMVLDKNAKLNNLTTLSAKFEYEGLMSEVEQGRILFFA